MIERTYQKRSRDLGGFVVGRVLPVGAEDVFAARAASSVMLLGR